MLLSWEKGYVVSTSQESGALSTTYRSAGDAWNARKALVPGRSHRALVSRWPHRTYVSLHAWKAWLSLFTLWASVSRNSLITLLRKKLIIKNDLFYDSNSCSSDKGSGWTLAFPSCGTLSEWIKFSVSNFLFWKVRVLIVSTKQGDPEKWMSA